MNWDLKGCSGRCIKCNKDFNDEETYFCRLFLEKEGPRREDYCENCWGAKQEAQGAHSVWQGRYKVEPVKIEEETLQEPVSKQLLKKWINSTERLHQCFCYVLAIHLERSKTFSEKPSIKSEDGKKQLVYEDRDTGETFILEDPCLTLKELDEVEGQLQEMFKQELNIKDQV